MLVTIASAAEAATPGLLAALPWKEAAGVVASVATVFGAQRLVPTYDHSFYETIKKPSWNPPRWLFPVMWIPLKLMQSVAFWLALKHSGGSYAALPAAAFAGHLALGNYWNVVFFGQQRMRESLYVMGAFFASIFAAAGAFYPASHTAAALMLPTAAWVSVAAKLNYDIVKLNPDHKPPSDKKDA